MSRLFRHFRRIALVGLASVVAVVAACSSQPLVKTSAIIYVPVNVDGIQTQTFGIQAVRLQDGAPLWFAPQSGRVGEPVMVDGVVYTNTSALRASDGKLLFQYHAQGTESIPPVIVGNAIYLADWAGEAFVELDRSTGDLISSIQTTSYLPDNYHLSIADDILVVPTYIIPHRDSYDPKDHQYIVAMRLIDGKQLWQEHVDYYDEIPFLDVARGMIYADIIDTRHHTSKLEAHDEHSGRLLWQQSDAYAEGIGSPAVVGNRLYISSYQGVEALDATTGAIIWRHPILYNISTVVVSDDEIYLTKDICCAGQAGHIPPPSGDISALRMADGSIVWQKHFQTVISPLIYQDHILAIVGGLAPTYELFALRGSDGGLLWHNKLKAPVND